MYPDIPLCMHQDHGERVSTCLSAIPNGFTSVMMDGSLKEDAKTPADYDYNVAVTKKSPPRPYGRRFGRRRIGLSRFARNRHGRRRTATVSRASSITLAC